MTKICSVCKTEKSLDDFYNRPIEKDGKTYNCKSCVNEAVKRYRHSPRGKQVIMEAKRRWRTDKHEAIREDARDRWRKNKERYMAATVKREQKNPEQRKAQNKVKNAIRTGAIVRPKNCERCGIEWHRIEASHTDYSKPMEVEWLCVPCHRRKDAARTAEQKRLTA